VRKRRTSIGRSGDCGGLRSNGAGPRDGLQRMCQGCARRPNTRWHAVCRRRILAKNLSRAPP
jgi:hypothetical protein